MLMRRTCGAHKANAQRDEQCPTCAAQQVAFLLDEATLTTLAASC
jgi:rubrerythrin